MKDIKHINDPLSQYIKDLCADNGITEMVCIYETKEKKTEILHYASDCKGHPFYTAIFNYLKEIAAEVEIKILQSQLQNNANNKTE